MAASSFGCGQSYAATWKVQGLCCGVLFYGVVSAQTEKVVEFFLEREAAEAMIDEVREDEPLLAQDLRVEAVELGEAQRELPRLLSYLVLAE
jgi:hypothetical protein